MSEELIIIVDPDDNELGTMEKIRAHQYGMLHRAFSILLFRKKNQVWQTLLQQRSLKKYHGGGLWTNTCCSHPRPNEALEKAAARRLQDEMGIITPLQEVGVFHYFASLDKGMIENEIDHVLIGIYDEDEFSVNPEEVDDYLWMDVEDLQLELVQFPNKYSPWIKPALEIASRNINSYSII